MRADIPINELLRMLRRMHAEKGRERELKDLRVQSFKNSFRNARTKSYTHIQFSRTEQKIRMKAH